MTYEEFERLAVNGASLSFKHGNYTVSDAKTVKGTGEAVEYIMLCQDLINGYSVPDKLGYKYSFAVNKYNFSDLTHIVFKDKQSDLLLNI